tara:strand:+ start:316 stop:546 length:231 start_codon:yes stop_codon:yes gene_type:complete
MTKKIKLTEATLTRIVQRVINEQKKDEAMEQLMLLFKGPKTPENEKKIADFLLKNPHLKALQGALTPEGKNKTENV